MIKTHYIIAIAILVGLAFLAGGMVGTHIERTHHENWFGKYDKGYIKYLEAQNKKVAEHWKECHDELSETQRSAVYIPKHISDSLRQLQDNIMLEKLRAEMKYREEKKLAEQIVRDLEKLAKEN